MKLEVVEVKNGSWLERRQRQRPMRPLPLGAPFHCRDEFDDFVRAIEIFVVD